MTLPKMALPKMALPKMALPKRLIRIFGLLVAAVLLIAGAVTVVRINRKETGDRITRGQAAKAIALVFATREECMDSEVSLFGVKDQDGWFVPYMDYLYGNGTLDESEIEATQKSAEGSLTGEELYHILERLKIIGDWDYLKKEPLTEDLWWRVYDRILESYDTAGKISPLLLEIREVLRSNDMSEAWQVQTNQGTYRFDGLAMDYYRGRTIRVLCRGNEIIRILGIDAAESNTDSGPTFLESEDIHREESMTETEQSSEPEEPEEGEIKEPSADKTQGEKIRVLIQASDYSGKVHESVVMTSSEAFTLGYEEKTQRYEAGSLVTIDRNLLEFAGGRLKAEAENGGTIQLLSVHRSGGTPAYPGTMQYYLEKEGIVVVNEVDLEEYLCLVVPSEMPAGYGLEPAKVQAVCARSYAWRKIHGGVFQEYEAHVDDSTSYQVYNNIPAQEVSTEAVRQTRGQMITYNGSVVQPYYFSTSCGYTTNNAIWGSDPAAYPYIVAQPISPSGGELHLENEDVFRDFIRDWTYPAYENGYAWYRWRCTIKLEEMNDYLRQRLEALEDADAEAVCSMDENGVLAPAKITDIGEIQSIEVAERGAGGIVSLLKIEGTKDTVYINKEIVIRKLLGAPSRLYQNMSEEGQQISEGDHLPSAFFCLEGIWEEEELVGYEVYGGGNGHGIGMPQNGVDAMAKTGKTYEEILKFFYPAVSVETVYGQ